MVVGVGVAAVALALLFFYLTNSPVGRPVSTRRDLFPAHTAEPTVATSAPDRKIYPMSVIRGGAYSREELDRARRNDAVVAAHYAGFGAKASFQKLSRDEMMYVSYRRSNRVYWSKVQHRIAQGETIISDGNCLARARCGNRLSRTAQQPVEDRDVPEQVLNTPEIPDSPVPYRLADLPLSTAPILRFDIPPTYESASTPVASVAPGGGAITPGAGTYGSGPGGFFGGGGAGPFLARPATNSSPSAGLPITTAGGSSLPALQSLPVLTPIGGGVLDVPVAQVTPEPGTMGQGLIFLVLAALAIGLRWLRHWTTRPSPHRLPQVSIRKESSDLEKIPDLKHRQFTKVASR
jgi:hypothetical protein